MWNAKAGSTFHTSPVFMGTLIFLASPLSSRDSRMTEPI
jgi:hypothetical protein